LHPQLDCGSLPSARRKLEQANARCGACEGCDDLSRGIRAPIIDDQYFIGSLAALQIRSDCTEIGKNPRGLIMSRDDDGEIEGCESIL